MKTSLPLLGLLALLVGALLIPIGCRSTQSDGNGGVVISDNDQTIRKAASSVMVTTQIATYLVLEEKPQARKYFETGVVILEQLLSENTYDPVAIVQALKKIQVDPDSGLDQGKALLFISSGLQLYTDFFQDNVNQKLPIDRVRPILVALRNGVKTALALKEPPAAVQRVRGS